MGERFGHSAVIAPLLLLVALHAHAADYPPGFIWGAGVNARAPQGIEENRPGFWTRFREDIGHAKALGIQSMRLTLSWERIEPAPGVFSTRTMDRYEEILLAMREAGIRPLVTLHHYELPAWFHEKGGWLSPDSPRLFLRYASHVVEKLSGQCDLWLTFNEPMSQVMLAYANGEAEPRMRSLDAAFEAAFQMARSHRIVAAMIRGRRAARTRDSIGGVALAARLPRFEPLDPANAHDLEATRVAAELYGWAFLESFARGRLEFDVPVENPAAHRFSREFPKQDLPPWDTGPALDWLGVNYYTRFLVAHDPKTPNDPLRARWTVPDSSEEAPWTDGGWPVHAEGLEAVLRETSRRFPSLPLVITENGVPDAADALRPAAIRSHLEALDRALRRDSRAPATDVRGYYHWSLLDGFEWRNGFEHHYGLLEKDRQPRASARVYAEEISKRN